MKTQYIDVRINVRVKLASLWTSLMFIIIYLDYFHLYMPSSLKDITDGKVHVYQISQGFLLVALCMVTIPALMIFLAVALPKKANRWVNIVIAGMNIPLILYNLAGVVWSHMIVGAAIQVILLVLIIYYAWKWNRI